MDLRELLSYPPIYLPLSLTENDGSLKKAAKSSFSHKIETDTPPTAMLQKDHAFIVDGTAYVQQIKSRGLTFNEFSTKLLNYILSSAKCASRVDVVFNVYLENSNKDVERQRRSTDKIVVKQIICTSQIKQLSQQFSSRNFKNKLVSYILNHWKIKRELLKNKILYVNDASET